MGRFPVEHSHHHLMFGHAIRNELWEALILIIPCLFLPCLAIHPNKFTPILSKQLFPIKQYATETKMAILAENMHQRFFDQMLDNRNKRMVTHFITCAAMCVTVNSFAIPSTVLKLWFNH